MINYFNFKELVLCNRRVVTQLNHRRKNKMANLVYYRNERETFKNAFQKKMKYEEAEIVFEKLCRHFKLHRLYQKLHLHWTSGSRCPKAFGTSAIKLNVDCNNFGVLCHELAHIKSMMKYGKMGHNKRHQRIMRTMISYCEKKNWFEIELQRRLTPKPAKPELTQQEITTKTIERLGLSCKRYQTKIKMYGKKLHKAQLKIGRLRAKMPRI